MIRITKTTGTKPVVLATSSHKMLTEIAEMYGFQSHTSYVWEIAEETAKLKAQQGRIVSQLRKDTAAQEKLHIVPPALETADYRLTQ